MEELTITFWYVQHGHAIHINRSKNPQTPYGWDMVIDLGSGDLNNQPFSPLEQLTKAGIVKLEYVIITHPHKDHIDDIMNFDSLTPVVLSRPHNLDKNLILENILQEHKHLFDKYFEIDARYSHPVTPETDPKNPENTGGLIIKTFSPDECSENNLNNRSIVTCLDFFGMKVLIPGDNENCSWTELLQNPNFVENIKGTHIFLASHHGRDSGYDPRLFDHFTPVVTIVSDGRRGATDAVPKYTNQSSGWQVDHRSGKPSETRKCLTTRNDGHIVLKLQYDIPSGKKFIGITID